MEHYAGIERGRLADHYREVQAADYLRALRQAGVIRRVVVAAMDGVAPDPQQLKNIAQFGHLILQMGDQSRKAALERILDHLKRQEYEQALFTLKLVSLGSAGSFSALERKQLTELIESVMPPDMRAKLDAQTDALEGGHGEGVEPAEEMEPGERRFRGE